MRYITLLLLLITLNGYSQLHKGSFIGHVIAETCPDREPLTYKIIKGNSVYSTFMFGTGTGYNDHTGDLYVRNINGIYNKYGNFRYPTYKLTVRVTDAKYKYKDVIVTINLQKYYKAKPKINDGL